MNKKPYRQPILQTLTITSSTILSSSDSLGVGTGSFGGEGGAPARKGQISYSPQAPH